MIDMNYFVYVFIMEQTVKYNSGKMRSSKRMKISLDNKEDQNCIFPEMESLQLPLISSVSVTFPFPNRHLQRRKNCTKLGSKNKVGVEYESIENDNQKIKNK